MPAEPTRLPRVFVLFDIPPGDPFALDARIDDIMGRKAVGSGASCSDRDLEYEFFRLEEAEAAATKLRKLDICKKVKVFDAR